MGDDLDDQARSLAIVYVHQIAEDVEDAVKHVTSRGKNLKGDKEIQFRNTVGTMQLRAHLFAALVMLQSSGMPNEDIIRYVAKTINTMKGMVETEVKIH